MRALPILAALIVGCSADQPSAPEPRPQVHIVGGVHLDGQPVNARSNSSPEGTRTLPTTMNCCWRRTHNRMAPASSRLTLDVQAWELKCQYGLHLQDRHCICSFYEEVRIDTLPTDKAQLTKHVQERIETVGKRFQELELTAMKAGEVDARAKIERARQAITEKRDALEQQLKAAREAGDAALAETREGVVAAWTELNEAFEKAREELEGVTA